MKRCVLFAAIIFVLCTGALAQLDFNNDTEEKPPEFLEKLAKSGVEIILSILLETKATVSSVRLNAERQQLQLNDLVIANPKGFDSKTPAFSAKRVLLEADPAVLFSPKAVVRVVELEGGTVHAEAKIGRGINLKKLLNSANRFKNLAPPHQKRWIIEQGVIKDCLLRFACDVPPRKAEYQLDNIQLSMKGPNDQGVTSDQAVAEIINLFLKTIADNEGTRLGNTLRQIFDR